MIELKNKSDDNIRSAEILNKLEYRCYASSVHCSYYSCLQYMAFIIISEKLIDGTFKEEQNKSGKGSHQIIKYTFEIDYIKRQKDSRLYNNFREWIKQLEQIRIEGDYYETKIELDKSKKSFDLAKKVLNQLKSVYKK